MSCIRIILHGKAAGDARLRAAVNGARRDGHAVDVRVTWEAGDSAKLAAEAVREAHAGAIDCIVAGGGDGTINEVFAAAYSAGLPQNCSLGLLPFGTANDFARSAGVPADDIASALRFVASAVPRRIDLGFLNGHAFINLASGGFGSRVTVETDPKMKQRLGGLAYAITGITRYAELAECHGAFRGENFSWEGNFLALAIGNGRYAGGGIPLCPNALMDDGLCEVTILPVLDRAARLDAYSRLLRHGVASIQEKLITARTSWIEYESNHELNVNLDGEPTVVKKFRVEMRAGAISVRLGEIAALERQNR
jgi:lipid kinase YegS